MKKLFCTLIALIGLQVAASAQSMMGMPVKEDLEKVKARPMLVVLREEDPKITNKLKKKPEALAQYKADIETYNTKIQKIAPQFWTLSKSVIFKTETELKELQKAKSKEYAYLEYRNEKMQENYGYETFKRGTGDQWTTAAIEIRFTEKPAAPPAGYATMLSGSPTDLQLALAVKSLQGIYNSIGKATSRKELHAQGIKKLKTKTLLLDKDLLASGLNEKTIKAAYPYPFKIVDNATIENAVLNSEKEYAVINITPVMGIQAISHMVSDTSGDPLSADVPSLLSKSKEPMMITKESLAQYLKTK